MISGAVLALVLSSAARPSVQAGTWVQISGHVLNELAKTHPVSSDPYATGTAGISVDRTNGDVYMLANNIGICKSTDQGRTFALVSGASVGGRFETSGGLNIDPRGGRLMCFAIYGPSAYSPDAGETWISSKVSHLDYGAVDWSDSGRALLAIAHESGGKLLYSQDAGITWTTVGTDHSGVGLFDRKTLVTSDANGGGIFRSADAGMTWTKVSDETPASPVMVEFKRTGYWLGEHGLLVSKSKGQSWNIVAPLPAGASVGPMFGRDERHIVVGAPTGLYQSSDGGKSWSLAAPLAPEITVLKFGKYATYGWDPIHQVFYASQMIKPAYRFETNR